MNIEVESCFKSIFKVYPCICIKINKSKGIHLSSAREFLAMSVSQDCDGPYST